MASQLNNDINALNITPSRGSQLEVTSDCNDDALTENASGGRELHGDLKMEGL